MMSSCRRANPFSSLGANIGIEDSSPLPASFCSVPKGGKAITAHANGLRYDGRPSTMLVEAVADVITVAVLVGAKPDVMEKESSVALSMNDLRRFDPKVDNRSPLELDAGPL